MLSMLNICLCDDDKKVINYYSKRIIEILEDSELDFKIGTYINGESLIFALEENPNKFNIMIIDIIMKDINGIETAKLLRKYGYEGIIIFLTSSKEFALDSFEVEPLSYILKDNKDSKFDEVFLKAVLRIKKDDCKNILISTKSQNKMIDINTVIYMESLNKKVILHKSCGEVEEVNCGLSEMYLKVIDHGFIRCHKSYIANSKYVQIFNSKECALKNKITLPIGRKYLSSFRSMLLENEFDDLIT